MKKQSNQLIRLNGFQRSMEDEYDSLVKNHTWILAAEDEIPPGQQAFNGKLVYRIKTVSK